MKHARPRHPPPPLFKKWDRVEVTTGELTSHQGTVVEVDIKDRPRLVQLLLDGAARPALIHETSIRRLSVLELIAQAANEVRRR